MKRAVKLFIKLFIVIVIVVNLPIINKDVLHSLDSESFKYANNDASFTDSQHFGFKDSYMSQEIQERWVNETNPEPINREIFRLYKINPLCFWRWNYYIFSSLSFKYKSWSEIEPNRVPRDPENFVWQHF